MDSSGGAAADESAYIQEIREILAELLGSIATASISRVGFLTREKDWRVRG
jgi:hypothetical protein